MCRAVVHQEGGRKMAMTPEMMAMMMMTSLLAGIRFLTSYFSSLTFKPCGCVCVCVCYCLSVENFATPRWD